jgi:PGF-CTERM protein
VENLTVLRGDGSLYRTLDSVGAVDRARETGNLTAPEPLVPGETLVVRFRSTALNRSVAGGDAGETTTERFFDALESSPTSEFAITRSAGPGCEPVRLPPESGRAGVLHDAANATFAVVMDTETFRAVGGCGGDPALPGDYEVAVTVAGEDRRRTVEGPLRVRASEDATLTAAVRTRHGAPGLATELDDAAAVGAAARAGRLRPTTRLVRGETLTLSFTSDRLNASYARTTGPNATARLRRALDAVNGSLSIVTDRERLELDGAAGSTDATGLLLGGPGVRTHRDAANATFHLVVDSRRATVARSAGDRVTLANTTEESYFVRVVVPGGASERFTQRFAVVDAGTSLRVVTNASTVDGDGPVVLDRGGGFGVRGETNLVPGTTLTARVVTANGSVAVTRRLETTAREATPDEEGSAFAGRFDGGTLDDGRGLRVELAYRGRVVDRRQLVVGRSPVLRNATVRRLRTDGSGPTAEFAVTARFPGPGFVVVNSRNGFSTVPVPAGEPTRVTGTVRLPPRPEDAPDERPVRLIAVYDANRNRTLDPPRGDAYGDPAFRRPEDGVVAASVELGPPLTPTAPPPGTTIAVEEGQTGFGVAGALAALLAGGALLARRHGGP